VLRSEILFRCCNWTSCSELIFAADLCVAQRNSVSLPQLNLLQRIDIRRRFVCCAAKLWRQQRCSLPNWAARSEPVLAADSYNKPPRQEWLKC
jgi:hypothetical protein